VLKTGQPLLVDDADELADIHLRHAGDVEHTRAVVAVPLRLGETVLGMLSAQSYAPNVYSPDDLQLLEVLAVNAAIAVSNARLFEQVQRLAITDALTGLHNRRHFFSLAEREFARAVRYDRAVAAIMLDIDHFKAVNDAHGHAVGDEVLREVAARCTASLRSVDLLGRYGGEEFVALLPETDWKGTRDAADRLRDSIGSTPIATQAGPVCVTVSVGFALCAENCTDLAALIHHADQALYAAKVAGRNRVEPA
jgi:diguanylate cyclase (GGDEF)-like protein